MKNWKEIHRLIQNERKLIQNPVINYLLMILLEITEKKIHVNKKRWQSKSRQRRIWKMNRVCTECGNPTDFSKFGKAYIRCKRCRWTRNRDCNNYRLRMKLRNSK